jgi:hypothetical protein
MARVNAPIGARPSLTDVRRRVRRHNRRRMVATAGVLACTGVATTALIIRRDAATPSATGQSEPADGVLPVGPATTFYQPGLENATTTVYGLPTMTITASSVWDALWNARYDPAGTGLAIAPADQDAANVMPTAEQFGCTSDQCRAMFNYVIWHEISKELGFVDVRDLQAVNPMVDFSQPPHEGDVLQSAYSSPVTPDTSDFYTASTIACDQTGAAPTVVVVNASHGNGVATIWRGLLAATVPNASFADAVNAVAPEPRSRVLALSGFECQASQIASFVGGAFDAATAETLQSLVKPPLPAGTSIVVLVGDDKLEPVAGGVTTTTSTTVAPTTSNL